MLEPTVTAAVLFAAIAHAGWNAIVHAVDDKRLAMGLIGFGGVVVAAPMAALSPLPRASAWPWLLLSASLHFSYALLLAQAYRLGDFGQMYPLARGISPLAVTVTAVVAVHEVPTRDELVGVLVIFGALSALVLIGRHTVRVAPAALAAAIGTGLAIAAYTTVDGVGVRQSHSTVGYAGWLLALEGSAMGLYAFARARPRLRLRRAEVVRGLAGGGLSVVAYGLVLWAQTRAPLAPVAALRETSVIAAAVIGTLLFREPFGRARIVATVGVSAGILLLTLH